jgi:hypothetical protein
MSDKTNWAVNVYRDGVIVAIFQDEHDADAYLLSKLDDGPKWTKKKCAINLKGLMNALLPAYVQ